MYRPDTWLVEFRLAWPGRSGDLLVTTVQPFVLTERYARLAGTYGYEPRTRT